MAETNGNSWAILESLKSDLSTYLEDNKNNDEKFVIEIADKVDIDLLDDFEKKRFKDFRIGLYEISPDDVTIVSGGKTADYNAAYEISIFKALTKDGQYDETIERRLMNVKDLVFDWINQASSSSGTNLNSVTSGKLFSLRFASMQTPIRQPRYASVRLQMTGFRNTL